MARAIDKDYLLNKRGDCLKRMWVDLFPMLKIHRKEGILCRDKR